MGSYFGCGEYVLNVFIDRLLDLLSVILSGQQYKPLGAPATLAQGNITSLTRDISATQNLGTGKNPELIKLALDTLGAFDFSGKMLFSLIMDNMLIAT